MNSPVEGSLHEHLKSALKNPVDDPKLPRVLIIGDSISIGYTIPVRKLLKGKANVHRPPVNCQHSTNLKEWLENGKWDVIHFNFGIWDTHHVLKKDGSLVRLGQEVSPRYIRIRNNIKQYKKNLTEPIKILKTTDAKLIWANSTPIMFRKGKRFKDIFKYNKAAAEVMRKYRIPINGPYSFVLPDAAKLQSTDQCHFNDYGNEQLGKEASNYILKVLTTAKE